MVPRPKEVTPLNGYKLKVLFDNGEMRLFDMMPLLDMPCYKRLKNPAIFNTVKAHDVTLEWVTGEDICPDRLYNEGKPVVDMLKRVTAVQPLDDYQLLLTFNSEEKRVYDMTEWLEKPYFKPLKDYCFFCSVRVNPVTHTVEWDGERDLSPDMLYEDSHPVA